MRSDATRGDARGTLVAAAGGMAMTAVELAAILMGAALLASMVSVEVGISVALVELALGVALGNTFNLDANAGWLVWASARLCLPSPRLRP